MLYQLLMAQVVVSGAMLFSIESDYTIINHVFTFVYLSDCTIIILYLKLTVIAIVVISEESLDVTYRMTTTELCDIFTLSLSLSLSPLSMLK